MNCISLKILYPSSVLYISITFQCSAEREPVFAAMWADLMWKGSTEWLLIELQRANWVSSKAHSSNQHKRRHTHTHTAWRAGLACSPPHPHTGCHLSRERGEIWTGRGWGRERELRGWAGGMEGSDTGWTTLGRFNLEGKNTDAVGCSGQFLYQPRHPWLDHDTSTESIIILNSMLTKNQDQVDFFRCLHATRHELIQSFA